MSKWLIGDAVMRVATVEAVEEAQRELVRRATTSEIMRKHAESVLTAGAPKVTTNATSEKTHWVKLGEECHKKYLKEQQEILAHQQDSF